MSRLERARFPPRAQLLIESILSQRPRRLITEPDPAVVSGKFFDGLRERKANEQAYDAKARLTLRDLSEQWTGAPAV